MNDPDTSNIVKTFNKLYEKQSYFEKYGIDVIIALIIIFIFFIASSYYYVMCHITPIKKNWNKEKCNPIYIPFAGIILNDPNKSILEVTDENFNGCIKSLLSSIIGIVLEPLFYILSMIKEVASEIGSALNSIRAMFNNIRNSVKDVSEDVMSRTLNITAPIVEQTIIVKSIAGKTQGIFTGALFTMFGAYETLRSFIGSIIEIIILLILIPLSVIIIGLFAAAFFTFGATLPEAFGLLAVFTAIVLPLTIIILDVSSSLSVKPNSSIPATPSNSCFDKNTHITLQNGEIKPICEIENGDILEDNSIVTATMQMSSKREDMYNINNTIVSGYHKFYMGNKLISCIDNNYGEKITDYNKTANPILYCFNTTNKHITINNVTYTDYDECSSIEIKYLTNKYDCNICDINKKCDISFHSDTLIKLNDNSLKKISDINVDDILENNNKVIGKITIDSNNVENIYKFKLDNHKNIIYSNKLYLENKSYIDFSLSTKINLNNNEKLYNLVTESSHIKIGNINVLDYNSSLDMELINLL